MMIAALIGRNSVPSGATSARSAAPGRTRRSLTSVVALAGALLAAGCQTFKGEPERLYAVAEEAAMARDLDLPNIVAAYNAASTDIDKMRFRNEYIARRMYVVDLEYTEFETGLTSERQEFGFGSAVVAQGLSTAGAVFTPASTVRILSALTSGVNATRGFYDSELLVNKTIQIVQSQMQSKRDDVATRIFGRVKESSLTYPLSAALHDLEDYYRAGTLTSGLIKATAEAGNNAQTSAKAKAAVVKEQAVPIANVSKPLPPLAPLAIVSPTRLTPTEQGIAPLHIMAIQTALCVVPPTDDFGARDSPARKALSDFFESAGVGTSQTIDNPAMLNLLESAVSKVKVRKHGTCKSAGFADAHAVGATFK